MFKKVVFNVKMFLFSDIPIPRLSPFCIRMKINKNQTKSRRSLYLLIIKNVSRVSDVGDIEVVTYLVNTVGPVTGVFDPVLDLRLTHERWGSRSDRSLNGPFHYPHDFHGTLNV
jgi:hypothetical protein